MDVLDTLQEMETRISHKPDKSRILGDEFWRKRALLMLAQLKRVVFESLLANTLPQRALGDLDGSLRKPSTLEAWRKMFDPVIYLNYIADRNGLGLSCDELERFCTTLEIAAGIKEDVEGAFTVNGVPLSRGIDAVLSIQRKGPTRFKNEANNLKTLQQTVSTIVEVNRKVVLPGARSQKVDHIAFKAEVGYVAISQYV